MYLRSLELLGFKSFARKTELLFPKGVAAVVGPNGCGKSNVLDALRWALGEQSAKALRGAEMADVIFNGNDRLPALGMAEVSLTFSDCEVELGTAYHEVRVTRRVYRDGGSEYLLNGVSCRLRDIQELFMDTGIGRSAYSVMEQGRIDQILSSRPEERRAIFEEAAGITKYKSQRRDALRKLEATEANLARLSDVLGEVRRQLATLGRQAAKARRWKALHADLKLLETHLAHGEFQRLTDDATASGAALADARSGLETAARALTDDESVLGYRRAALERHDNRLEVARAALNEAHSRLAHAESRLTFNRERLVEGAARIERLRTDLAEGRETLAAAQARLAETGAAEREALERLAEGQELQRAEDARLRDLRNGRTAAEAALTAAARRVVEAENRMNAARAELARAETEQAAAGARRDLLTGEIATATPALEAAAARVAEARNASMAANAALESVRAEAAEAEAATLGAQREAAALDAAERTAARTAADVSGRLDALRRLTAEGEGLAAGAKAALRGAGRGDIDKARILGALGSLIRVRDARHIVAVETALGAHLGTVLVADEDAAALILQTLSERKLGRAAVAPPLTHTPDAGRDAPPGRPSVGVADAQSGHPGGASLPGDSVLATIEFPPHAAPLLARLLAETFIVNDLPAARALRQQRPDAAAVTLTGEWLSRENVWHGGRGANDGAGQSILQRQSQIAALEAETSVARARLAEATANRETATARAAELAETGRAARVRVNTAQTEATTAAAAVGPVDREERGLRLRLEGFRRELTDFERRFQEIAGRAARLGADMQAQTAARERAETERTEAAARVEDLRAQEAALTETVNEIRVRVAAENQRHVGLQREKLPVVARVRELETLLANRQRELEDGERRLAGSAVEAEQLGGTIAIAKTEGEIATKQVAELVQERAATITAIGELETALRTRRTEVAALQERRAAEEVREAGLRLRADTLHARIAERYQTDLRMFAPNPAAFESVRYVRADEARADGAPTDPPALVARLNEGLEAIGAVNLDSIAEHDALEERNRFLETQDSDLRRAEAELRGIIGKINETSRALFVETFAAIRRGFGEMFGELFGGGRADLQMLDGDDPLECGIEITARPPGKPAQSLSLLSGGEKTMTAVALLFAIYLVKPSPFCVLDEMDAPLDESNVGRFVRLLDRFAATSQFVVITHNKRTMARADALFGVTMEEPGISKLVAVRLARADEAGAVPATVENGQMALG